VLVNSGRVLGVHKHKKQSRTIRKTPASGVVVLLDCVRVNCPRFCVGPHAHNQDKRGSAARNWGRTGRKARAFKWKCTIKLPHEETVPSKTPGMTCMPLGLLDVAGFDLAPVLAAGLL
jgi:hypothetical protein